MTADRLAEIRQRLAAATPGPWLMDTLEGGGWAVVIEQNPNGATVVADLDETTGNRAANAAFIAAAPDDIAWLVLELERSQTQLREALARVERLEAALEGLRLVYHKPDTTMAQLAEAWLVARWALTDNGDAGPERAAGLLGVPLP